MFSQNPAAANSFISQEDQQIFQMADSATTMAATDFWKHLVALMVEQEADTLGRLYQYFKSEAHPDREEVMTLTLRWFAVKYHRLELLHELERYQQLNHNPMGNEENEL